MSKKKTVKEPQTVDTNTGEVVAYNYTRPLYRTPHNAKYLPFQAERSELPSNTIPEQSLSIKQLLHRHQKGLPLDAPLQNAIYEGENEEFPDLSRLDLAEQQELLEAARRETKELEGRLEDQAKLRRQAKAEAARKQERKKWEDELKLHKEQKGEHGFRNDQPTT